MNISEKIQNTPAFKSQITDEAVKTSSRILAVGRRYFADKTTLAEMTLRLERARFEQELSQLESQQAAHLRVTVQDELENDAAIETAAANVKNLEEAVAKFTAKFKQLFAGM